MAEDVAIEVKGVSKTFKLPHERHTSVKSAFINFYKNHKGYEKQQVLEDISFEIKKGEFFGIVGRNGSGKSTLLKLLAGIYEPDEGNITITGKLTPFIELGVGFNPELSGRENVYLNGALLGFSRKEMDAMYNDIVQFAELEQFMDQKLKNYSSGMQVRLAFSVAIRANTDILLIDEVLAVGDQSFQEKCFDFFSEIKKSGKTVIFVTHDMSNVERFCDRVFVLDKKKEVNGLYSIPEAVSIYNRLNHENTSVGKLSQQKDGTYIKSVRLLSDGKEQDTFQLGEQLDVEIRVASDKSNAKPIVIGLAFYDRDGVNLAGPNSSGHSIKTNSEAVVYTIKNVPFNMGEYYLTAALFDNDSSKQYDLIDKGIKFFINSPSVHHGKIVLNDSWKET